MDKHLSDFYYFVKNVKEKGFFHLLSANVLIQVFSFASQMFVAGILSPEDVGRIKVIQTYLALFSIIASMGFNSSTLKICSEGRGRKENSKYFSSAVVFTTASTALAYLVVLIINFLGLVSPDKLIRSLIPLGMLPIASQTLFTLFASYLQSIKEFKLYSKITVFSKIFFIILIIIFTFYWGIKGYYTAYNISFLLMLVLIFVINKNKVNYTLKFSSKAMFNEHWRYAKVSTIAYFISEATAYIDILLINFLIKDSKEIGYYSFALTLCIALRMFPVTVQQMAIPYFSSFKIAKEKFLQIFNRYNNLLFIAVLVSLPLFLLIMPKFINIIYNGKYDPSFKFLFVLAIGWSLRYMNHLRGGAIFSLGKIKYNAMISLWTLVGSAAVYPFAIYYYGLLGAAYASIFCGLIIWISSRYYFKRAVAETEWDA